MEISTLIIISCICMLFVIGRIFIIPIKWVLKLIFNSILGGILIWIINLIGGGWGFHIGLNIYTSVLVRFFRNSRCSISNLFKIDYWLKKIIILRSCVTQEKIDINYVVKPRPPTKPQNIKPLPKSLIWFQWLYALAVWLWNS